MFYALVFTLCAGASAPVGSPCDEYVIDQLPSMKTCTIEMDKRIKAANVLFKGNDDWIISCEKTYTKEGK